MKFLAAVFALACCLSSPVVAAAQSADPDPLQVQPADVVPPEWLVGTEAIKAVPSPIGAALPGSVYVDVGPRGAEATLFLDEKNQRYTYECATGRCIGFAPDVWHALPIEDQRAYVDGVLDALMSSYPDLAVYRVRLYGIGLATWDADHGRAYKFNPPL